MLTFNVPPNYEAAADADRNNGYVVVVRATSGADARVKTAAQTITVTVTDVGGEAPGGAGGADGGVGRGDERDGVLGRARECRSADHGL